jgi:hypothetical protein
MSKLEDKDVATFTQFKGLRNTVGPESFDVGDLSVAKNVDLTDELRVQRRRGYTLFSAGSYHSLFAAGAVMLAVIGSSLVRVFPAGAAQTLRTGLTSGLRMAYAAVGNRIYYSNGIETGCVDGGVDRTWGLVPPGTQPAASEIGGLLEPGTYSYAITYVRSDGQESGTGAAGEIAISAGGIQFTDIPVSADPGVTAKYLYVSPPDGEMLFRVMNLAADAATAVYAVPFDEGMPLATQFKRNPLAGSCVAYFAGHTLVAVGSRLYVSETYAPELFDLQRGYRFSSPITLVAPVDDGVYLGTEAEIVFLAGKDVATLEYQPRTNYGAILGTAAPALAGDFEPGADGPAVVFASAQGICSGTNGGRIKNLTEERFSYPVTKRGAGVVRNHGGTVQYLVVLEGTETAAGNTAF